MIKDPEKRRAYAREYARAWRKRPEARERTRQKSEKFNQSERGKRLKREWHLRRYGVTLEQFDGMFEAQGKRCAICRAEQPGARGWCLDHCHTTGRFRGVLCMPCNLGIGYFKDDPDTIRNAITYLRGVP